MRPITAVAVGCTLVSALGCVSIPGGAPYRALDYRLDRPRVVGVRIDPVVIATRRDVTVEALALAPAGATPDAWSVDRCAFDPDLPTRIDDVECFGQAELVVHLADTMPATFAPPDLAETACDRPDTGIPFRVPDDLFDTQDDTGIELLPFSPCDSQGPVRVSARYGDTEASAVLFVNFRREPYHAWEEPPRPIAHRAHGFVQPPRAAQPGATVPFTYVIDGRVIDYRWYVDAGVLQGTGSTTAQRLDDGRSLTTNVLEVPTDHHGPLRVVVVAQGVLPGDMAWDVLTLEVP